MIVDKCRDIKEFYDLYNSCDSERLADPDGILSLGDYYRCFYDDKGKLVGCIYLEDEQGKTMLSGFGRRKSYSLIVEAIAHILWLNPKIDIYSRTDKLNARYVLREAGFKRVSRGVGVGDELNRKSSDDALIPLSRHETYGMEVPLGLTRQSPPRAKNKETLYIRKAVA